MELSHHKCDGLLLDRLARQGPHLPPSLSHICTLPRGRETLSLPRLSDYQVRMARLHLTGLFEIFFRHISRFRDETMLCHRCTGLRPYFSRKTGRSWAVGPIWY